MRTVNIARLPIKSTPGSNGRVLVYDPSSGSSATVPASEFGGGQAESVDWANVQNPPATATRWPSASEVSGLGAEIAAGRYTDTEAVAAAQSAPEWHAGDWDAAYSWGNHARAGYLKSVSWGDVGGKPDTATRWPDTTEVDGLTAALAGKLDASEKYTDSDAVAAIKADTAWKASQWNEAYLWGDHALAGYLKSVSWGDVSGKPVFSAVATSGAYSDLSGTPDPNSYATAAQGERADTALQPSDLPGSSVAEFSSNDSATNINGGGTAIIWNIDRLSDSNITATGGSVAVGEAGTYRLDVSLAFTTDVARANPKIRFRVNGIFLPQESLSGYVRAASGHNSASSTLFAVANLPAGSAIEVVSSQGAAGGVVTLVSGASVLSVEKIAGKTLSLTNADTLDGKSASDFATSDQGARADNAVQRSANQFVFEYSGDGGLIGRTLNNNGEFIFQARSSGLAPRFTVEHGATELRGKPSGWEIGGQPVWHGGNFSPAQYVRNDRITISPSDPTSADGKDGDIWLKYV